MGRESGPFIIHTDYLSAIAARDYNEEMVAQSVSLLTVDQYLEIERAAETKSEFYEGRMYAMSGGTFPHSRIGTNLTGELGQKLKKGPCFVNNSDLRVRAGQIHTYPDVSVVCGEPKLADTYKDTLLNPILVIEVLSPSTEAYDRGFKFAQYRQVESLQEYALVSQIEARIEIFRRQPTNEWLLSEAVGMDAHIRFQSVNCEIALADVYDKVTFDPPAPTGHPAPGA
jgi:Uma2 family endonuclease